MTFSFSASGERSFLTTSQGSPVFELSPGHFPFGLGEQNALEKTDRFLQSFADGHEAVLVLDGKRAVVPGHAQRRNEIAPEMSRVPITDRTKNPGTIDLVLVMLGVEHAIAPRVPFLHRRILGVDVPDRAGQRAHRFAWVPAF